MSRIFKFYSIFILIFLNFNLLNAENLKIAYVDIDKILSQSKVGIKINKNMENLIKKKNKEFQKIEEDLKKKNAKKIKQKNNL